MADIFDNLTTTAKEAATTVGNSLGLTTQFTGSGVNFGLPGGGNILNVTLPKFDSLRKELQPPNLPFGNLVWENGSPSIPPIARGVVTGSIIETTNKNLFHNCGFLMNLGFAGLTADIRSITNSITQIINTIKNPRKYGAAAIIRFTMFNLSAQIRKAINALIKAIGLTDPSGKISALFSQAKKVLSYVAGELRKAAKLARDIAMITSLATNLNQIINYIKSLPKQILAVLQNCFQQFLGSVNQLAKSVQSLPGVTNNKNTKTAFQSVSTNVNKTQSSIKYSASTANLPPSVVNAINTPSESNTIALTDQLNASQNTANTVVSQNSYSSQNKSQP